MTIDWKIKGSLRIRTESNRCACFSKIFLSTFRTIIPIKDQIHTIVYRSRMNNCNHRARKPENAIVVNINNHHIMIDYQSQAKSEIGLIQGIMLG